MKALVLLLVAALAAGLAPRAEAGPAAELASILKSCEQAEAKGCTEALWSFVDVTGDSRLTVAELSRFFRLAAELLAARGPEPAGAQGQAKTGAETGAEDDVALAVGGAFLTGPVAAKLVIANFDYDDDGAVSRQELFLDMGEEEFRQLLARELEKLPQRAGGLMMRALKAQRQIGGDK